MKTTGIDRRILRAFYTQYVAVLLIMLVFCVTAFHQPTRTNEGEHSGVAGQSHNASEDVVKLDMSTLFESDGSVRREHAELEAVAEMLRNHDLQVEFRFTVGAYMFSSGLGSLPSIARRVESIARFFDERQVSRELLRFVVRERGDLARDSLEAVLTSEEACHE